MNDNINCSRVLTLDYSASFPYFDSFPSVRFYWRHFSRNNALKMMLLSRVRSCENLETLFWKHVFSQCFLVCPPWKTLLNVFQFLPGLKIFNRRNDFIAKIRKEAGLSKLLSRIKLNNIYIKIISTTISLCLLQI